jgi:hypothetical protein
MRHRWMSLALAAAAAFAWLVPAAAGPAQFGGARPSAEARHVADWAVHSNDHAGMPFVIVDKAHSRVFVFDGEGRMLGAASALLGLALGDAAVPGIGERKMSSIRPDERTTPAGRFVATLARSLQGDDILWVDYDAAIALHRVIATVAAERRLQRLDSNVASDRRITYGCINVPVKFFDTVIAPTFREKNGIVYVLPETRTAQEVFGSYDVAPGKR